MSSNAKTSGDEDLPAMEPHQFSVTQSEARTGKVLTLDGRRRTIGSGDDWVLIFESFEDAERFVTQRIAERPDVECWVRSSDGKYHERFPPWQRMKGMT